MTQIKTVKTAAALFLLPALLLGACGQSAPTAVAPAPVVTPAPAAVDTQSRLSLSIFMPAVTSGQSVQAQSVQPQYVSSATTSLRVQLGSFDTTLALNSAACTPATGGQTCTFSLNVVPGASQTLTVSAYDSGSRLLGASTQTVSVVAGQDNPLSLVLTGVAASATFTVTDRAADLTPGASGSLLLDLGGSYSVGIALKDAASQTILNPGRPTETLSSSNPGFSVVGTGVGTFRVSAPAPTGAAQSTTITVQDAGGRTLATQVLTVPAQKVALSLSTTSPVVGSTLLATARLTSARGQALAVGGRVVTFGVSGGSLPGGVSTATTDATGTASLNVTAGAVGGAGTVTATSDSATGSAAYTSVTGAANATTSSVSLSPDSVKVNGRSTLTVTLKDGNNSPVTTPPTVSVSGNSTVGAVSQTGNVFTYTVTAAATPETATFTVTSGGNTVGAANLAVTAYPLTVSDGAAALVGGSRYDFQNGSAHAFMVAESNYTGSFTASSSNPAVAAASVSSGVLTVTPGGKAGFSTITVQDSSGQSFTFTVSATTASLVIN